MPNYQIKASTRRSYAIALADWLAGDATIQSGSWSVPTGLTVVGGSEQVNTTPRTLQIDDAGTERTFEAFTCGVLQVDSAASLVVGQILRCVFSFTLSTGDTDEFAIDIEVVDTYT